MFVDTDWEKQNEHQTNYVTFALGGPLNYTRKHIRECHANVNNGKYPEVVHFNAFAENLLLTLKDLKISSDEMYEVVKTIVTVKSDVLGLDEGVEDVKYGCSGDKLLPRHIHAWVVQDNPPPNTIMS